MAKERNGNRLKYGIYVTGAILGIVGLIISGALAWGDLENKIDNHKTLQVEQDGHREEQYINIIADADDLKVEGCKPAQKVRGRVDMLEYRTDELRVTQIKMETKVTAIQSEVIQIRLDTKEILSRLPK